MYDRAGAASDHLSTCYKEIAHALRRIIPTLTHLRSRQELESVAVCYEKLAKHRDTLGPVEQSAV